MSLLRARLLEAEQRKQTAQQAQERKLQVGTGDRSERIRTYNYPQGRVTDHRINLTLYQLADDSRRRARRRDRAAAAGMAGRAAREPGVSCAPMATEIRELVREGAAKLARVTDSPQLEAELLLARALGCRARRCMRARMSRCSTATRPIATRRC